MPSRSAIPSVRFAGPEFDRLLADIAQMTGDLEAADAWPHESFQRLAETGVLRWVIPQEWGELEVTSEELVYGYEQLARACLVTTFVLTQRNGACQRIAGAQNEALKADLLPRLAGGEIFATVGISHLTTSRQHWRKPPVRVETAHGRYVFNGDVPWVTGAAQADYIVTGGTCDDGRQVLAAIPTAADGVRVQPAARLLALNASQTASITLENVAIDDRHLLAGPVEQVMKRGRGAGTGSITTSALALGAVASALDRLKVEADGRPDLVEIHEPLASERSTIAADLYAAARGESAEENPSLSAESIRQRANSLVLRSSQAYLAASKGAGFTDGHPAGRAVREAMFFLVWSCPQPVLTAALREFACVVE